MTIPFLDVHAAYLEDQAEYDAAYQRVMGSGRWILGHELQAFEKEFARYCGREYCVGVGNGMDAISLALIACGIGNGDEVLVPSNTFIATWLGVIHAGAIPKAVEPDHDSFNISRTGIEAVITERTKAIIPVHLYGKAAEMSEIEDLCQKKGITLIEDAAQAHGASYRDRVIGSYGEASCFSFYPGKNLGAFGDGGAVVTDSPTIARTLQQLRSYGALERYQHQIEGYNSRLDELQAAWLRVRLRKLDAHNAKRRELASIYQKKLTGLGDLQIPEANPDHNPSWHLFVIRTAYRDGLQNFLARHGCETYIHYPKPVYRYLPFNAYAPNDETVSDRLSREILSLPIGPHLQADQVNHVCDLVKEFFHNPKEPGKSF